MTGWYVSKEKAAEQGYYAKSSVVVPVRWLLSGLWLNWHVSEAIVLFLRFAAAILTQINGPPTSPTQ